MLHIVTQNVKKHFLFLKMRKKTETLVTLLRVKT